MNPLTLVKRLQNINAKEADLGISEEASWHAKYKDSAYVFVGGLPYDLTEGDLLAVFAQYGEIVDVNLVRDKGTGKSKGFAFVAYEDQRSTILAVDNLNGAQILGRIIRVDHAEKYKKKEEEDEEEEKKKREARGVCYAFQKGECTRGAGCKFSHDEQRAANTGWGYQDNKNSKWGNDKFEGSKMSEEDEEEEKKKREARGVCYAFQRGECTRGARCKFSHDEQRAANTGRSHEDNKSSKWGNDKFEGSKKSEKGLGVSERAVHEGFQSARGDEKALEKSDGRDGKRSRRYDGKDVGPTSREYYDGSEKKRSTRQTDDDDRYIREEKGSRRHNDGDFEPRSVEDHQRRDEKRSRRHGDDGEQGARLKEDRRDGSRSKRHGDDGEQGARLEEDRRDGSRSKKHGDDDFEPRPNGDHDRRGEKRIVRNESESYPREDRDKRGGEKRTGLGYNRDSSSHRHGRGLS